MSDYLEVVYNEHVRPKTNYPEKLVSYLCDSFNIKSGMRLLEAGCGRGEHLKFFKQAGIDVCGLDISPQSVNLSSNLDVQICDFEIDDLPFPDEHFDVFFSKSLLEHLSSPIELLTKAKRVLKPGGLMIAMVPDWESQYKKYYDDFTHRSPFTKISLKNISLVAGFSHSKVFKFRQLPVCWKYPSINLFCSLISPFVPVRTNIPFFRWSRELMLVGSSYKPK